MVEVHYPGNWFWKYRHAIIVGFELRPLLKSPVPVPTLDVMTTSKGVTAGISIIVELRRCRALNQAGQDMLDAAAEL